MLANPQIRITHLSISRLFTKITSSQEITNYNYEYHSSKTMLGMQYFRKETNTLKKRVHLPKFHQANSLSIFLFCSFKYEVKFYSLLKCSDFSKTKTTPSVVPAFAGSEEIQMCLALPLHT